MDEASLGALALAGLFVVACGLLVVIWRAFGVYDRAMKDVRYWKAQAAASDQVARQFRDQLRELHEPAPARASRPLRVYDDTASARRRFDPPLRTEDVTDPARTQAEPAVPPIAEDTTRELRPALKLLTSRNRP